MRRKICTTAERSADGVTGVLAPMKAASAVEAAKRQGIIRSLQAISSLVAFNLDPRGLEVGWVAAGGRLGPVGG